MTRDELFSSCLNCWCHCTCASAKQPASHSQSYDYSAFVSNSASSTNLSDTDLQRFRQVLKCSDAGNRPLVATLLVRAWQCLVPAWSGMIVTGISTPSQGTRCKLNEIFVGHRVRDVEAMVAHWAVVGGRVMFCEVIGKITVTLLGAQKIMNCFFFLVYTVMDAVESHVDGA